MRSGDAWYLDSEVSPGPFSDGSGNYDRIAVRFVGVTADPHELLDFGLGASTQNDKFVEPDEPSPGH